MNVKKISSLFLISVISIASSPALTKSNITIIPPFSGLSYPVVSRDLSDHQVTRGLPLFGAGYGKKMNLANVTAFGEISGFFFIPYQYSSTEQYLTALGNLTAKVFIPKVSYKNIQCFLKTGPWMLRTKGIQKSDDSNDIFTTMHGYGIHLGGGVIYNTSSQWFLEISVGNYIPTGQSFNWMFKNYVNTSFYSLKLQIGRNLSN